MEKDILVDMSLAILSELTVRYKNGSINYADFCIHSKLKSEFLKSNISSIQSHKKRETIIELLSEYDKVIL